MDQEEDYIGKCAEGMLLGFLNEGALALQEQFMSRFTIHFWKLC